MIVLLFGAWYNADIKQRRRCSARFAAHNRRHHAFAKIKRIASPHACWPPSQHAS